MIKKYFAIQVRKKANDGEYWDWCTEDYWDGEGNLHIFSDIKQAQYRKRKLEKMFYKNEIFLEFRVVRVRYNRDYEVEE